MSDPQTRKLSHYFTHSKRKGRPGLPLASVTMNDGLVLRDDMDRKMDTSLSDEEHSLVEPGDIAYNMMRMWQGAFGLASAPVNVSPAYAVMRAKPSLDPRFAAHWLKSDRALYLLWAFSYGLTDDRLRLYPKEFLQIPVQWPDVAEQRRIAAVLDAWDETIAISEKLVAAKELQQGLLRAELVSGQPVALTNAANITPSGVDKKVAAGEAMVFLCNYMHIWQNKQLTSSVSYDRGSASPREIANFSLREGDFIFTKDSETANEIAEVAYVAETMPNVVCGYHLAVGRAKAGYVGAYLAHVIRLQSVRNEFAKRVNGSIRFGLTLDALDQIKIPVPDEDKQRKVASLLDAADAEILAQRELISLLRKQKRGLMQKLLTGQCRVPESIDALLPGVSEVAS